MISGKLLLAEALQELKIDLIQLVARCSLWVHPEAYRQLISFRPNAVWFPNCRRSRNGEKAKTRVDGVWLDDNSKANLAIKNAIFARSKSDCVGMHACHVWPRTCYDVRYHTALANIVLLPAALAALSDHDDHIAEVLKFRSFELFGWFPAEQPCPKRPERYPDAQLWAAPQPATNAVLARINRLRTDQ